MQSVTSIKALSAAVYSCPGAQCAACAYNQLGCEARVAGPSHSDDIAEWVPNRTACNVTEPREPW
eukprot:2787673-Amphidinium_carterae.2